jgi:hypothetical protein
MSVTTRSFVTFQQRPSENHHFGNEHFSDIHAGDIRVSAISIQRYPYFSDIRAGDDESSDECIPVHPTSSSMTIIHRVGDECIKDNVLLATLSSMPQSVTSRVDNISYMAPYDTISDGQAPCLLSPPKRSRPTGS